MKKGEERMDDRERKPDNRNNKKRNYQLYVILAIVSSSYSCADNRTGFSGQEKYDKKGNV